MTGAITAGVIVAVVAGIFWARAVASRADRRSIDNYERVRGVIGSVAKRSESSAASVSVPTEDEVARPHVRLGDNEELAQSDRPMLRPPLPPRIVLEPASVEHAASMPVFGDADPHLTTSRPTTFGYTRHRRRRQAPSSQYGRALDAGENDPDVPTALKDEPPSAEPTVVTVGAAQHDARGDYLTHVGAPRRLANRRAAVIGAVVIVAGAVSAGAWQLQSNGGGQRPTSAAPPRHSGAPARITPLQPVPSTLQPILVSATVVTYKAPAGTYTLSFSASDNCWIGIEKFVNGPYLWMTTLTSLGSAHYSVSGPVIVRIGAPPVAHLAVNGIPVALPSSKVNPYDVAFTSSSVVSP